MESLHIYRVSKNNQGFTLIEIVVVLALVGLIGSASVIYSLPAIAGFACKQETEVTRVAVERARFLSQFARMGEIKLKITEEGYEILDSHGTLIDQMNHQTPVPVSANGNIIFEQGSGSITEDQMEIGIGNSSSPCQQVITINNVGAII